MAWFANKGQIAQIGLQLVAVVGGSTVVAILTVVVQKARAVSLDWWVLGTLFVSSLIALWWVQAVANSISRRTVGTEEGKAPAFAKVETHRVILTQIKAVPDFTDDVTVTYKMKLRIELRNDSQDCIDVESVKWITGRGGVPGQPWSCLQLQRISNRQPGGGGWQLEESEIHVQQHGVFRVSVALDPSFSENDIRQRLAASQTGTLSLRVVIAQRLSEQQLHL